MSIDFITTLLWLSVLLPFILSLPVIHTKLPWPGYIAIAPAALLTIIPVDSSVQLSWFLFGNGLSIDNQSRWLLGMTVFVWILATSTTHADKQNSKNNREAFTSKISPWEKTFFLLTMSGNIGAILADDLVTFFSFTTLMGYSFYGLFVQHNEKSKRAARLYVIFLILADLALFEAMLLAAYADSNLNYANVRISMTDSAFYFWMTFIAFSLKAGIWPFHIWLLSTYRSTHLPALLLFGSVPVTMALTGIIQWLPLGIMKSFLIGSMIQVVGISGVIYTLFIVFTAKHTPRFVSLGFAGCSLFIVAVGYGVSHPHLWQQNHFIVYPFISILGIIIVSTIFLAARSATANSEIDSAIPQQSANTHIFLRITETSRQWINHNLSNLHSNQFNDLKIFIQKYYSKIEKKLNTVNLNWKNRITLLVLLALAFAWLAR